MRPEDTVPDVRDGLTRIQRIVLYELHKAQKETGREFVPSIMLWGRVVDHLSISQDELTKVLNSLGTNSGAR